MHKKIYTSRRMVYFTKCIQAPQHNIILMLAAVYPSCPILSNLSSTLLYKCCTLTLQSLPAVTRSKVAWIFSFTRQLRLFICVLLAYTYIIRQAYNGITKTWLLKVLTNCLMMTILDFTEFFICCNTHTICKGLNINNPDLIKLYIKKKEA